MATKKSVYNIFFGTMSQLIIISLGLIVPRIVLTNYGSDVNGYTNTVRQIFTYMALLEAGIGQSTLNALYGPIVKKDKQQTSSVLSASLQYYRKVTTWYAILVVIMSVLLPFGIKTNISKITAGLVVFLEGASAVIGFYYLEAWKQLLSADGRYYVIQTVTMVVTVLNYGVKIALSCIGVNIAIIQLGNFTISLIQMAIYKVYCKKKYAWVNFNAVPDQSVLKDRYAFMLNQVATTVFSSTDMIVLSIFGSTILASVYSIYGLVYNNLNNLLNAVYFGLVYILGQTWKQDRNKYVKLHDAFDGMTMWLITSTMATAYVLTIPFVTLYTKGVHDADYINYSMPLLFALIQLLSWSRYVSGNLTAIAGYAKSVSYVSAIEAAINLFFSIVLIQKYGIVGTLFATVIALPIKIIYCIVLGNIRILGRGVGKSLSLLLVNYILFAMVYIINQHVQLTVSNFFEFFLKAFAVALVIYPTCLVVNLITNQSMRCYVANYLRCIRRK